jgi:hypothetical protein
MGWGNIEFCLALFVVYVILLRTNYGRFVRRNQVQTKTTIRPIIPFTRIIFLISAFLAAIAGIQLYILTDHTDQFFAWTILNPLSAAFLGAGYWTGVTLLLFSTAERAWANIRIAIVAVCTFAPLILIATLLNLNIFHFQAHDLNPRIAAWAWMIVYVSVPFLLAAVVLLQLRTPGGNPPRGTPLPTLLRFLIGANAIIGLLVGLILFLVPLLSPTPEALLAFWPWKLTALTAQTIGVGFLSLGTASLQFLRENSWRRGRVGTVPYLLIGLLQLIAIARYSQYFHWGSPGAWLYLLYMLAIFGGGIYSTYAAWFQRSQTSLDMSS